MSYYFIRSSDDGKSEREREGEWGKETSRAKSPMKRDYEWVNVREIYSECIMEFRYLACSKMQYDEENRR